MEFRPPHRHKYTKPRNARPTYYHIDIEGSRSHCRIKHRIHFLIPITMEKGRPFIPITFQIVGDSFYFPCLFSDTQLEKLIPRPYNLTNSIFEYSGEFFNKIKINEYEMVD